MTNDPDLLDQPCPDCFGNGFFLDEVDDVNGESFYTDCIACDGEGQR